MSIQVADINPLRFIDNANLNKGFDGNYYVNLLNWYQTTACYFQTWLKSDILYLQVVADEVPNDLEFRDQYGNVIDTATWQAKNLQFLEYPDLICYELSYPFSNLPNGVYEAIFGDFGSEPFEVKDFDDETLLIKYKNSRNDFSSVFDTGIEFQIRLHASIHNYRPQNDRNGFIDQKHNNTQLSSVAYRRFTFTIGTRQQGVPNWVVDKYNIISQCDQISYDGIYYQIAAEAEPEVEPNPDYAFIWEYNIDIEPAANEFIRYNTEPDGSLTQTITAVQKVTRYISVANAFNASGIFKAFSILEKIVLYKSGIDFIMSIGVTPNGGEIVSNWNVDETKNTIDVSYAFDGTETVYFSGAGLNASMLFLLWKQMDEAPIPLPILPAPNLAKNAGVFFFEIQAGDLVNAFDLATGLGLSNGLWRDWAIAGTNGTPNMDGKLPIGWDRADAITIGTDKGSATITIGKVNLPAEGVDIMVSQSNESSWRVGGGSGRPLTNVGGVGFNDPIQTGKTANLGSGTPLPFTPLSLVCVYVIKIA